MSIWSLNLWSKPSRPSCVYEWMDTCHLWPVSGLLVHMSSSSLYPCLSLPPEGTQVIRVSYKGVAAKFRLASAWVWLLQVYRTETDRVTHSHFLTWTPFLVHLVAPLTSKTYLQCSSTPCTAQCPVPWPHRELRPETVSLVLSHKGFKKQCVTWSVN